MKRIIRKAFKYKLNETPKQAQLMLEKKLQRRQRQLSKKVKFSQNWRK